MNTPPLFTDPWADAGLDDVVSELRRVRLGWREASGRAREPAGRELPSPDTVSHIVDDLCSLMFPMRLGPPELKPLEEDHFVRRTLGQTLAFVQGQVRLELTHGGRFQTLLAAEPGSPALHIDEPATLKAQQSAARLVAVRLAHSLPKIRLTLDADVTAAALAPLAQRSVDELMLCNPGVRALIHHRIAHQLHLLGAPLVALMVADLAHSRTGIAIHPGAEIGPGCAIVNGTGLVIGAGVRLGRNVRLHQAVTLDSGDRQGHSPLGYPEVGDEVVIHAGATALGPLRIGHGACIGGHVWLTEDVPDGADIKPRG